MQVDLTGGYYDAGDNVKYNFPMAFTTTMLSWSTLEYGKKMGRLRQLHNARAAVRWSTDYLLKCATATSGRLYVGVGDPNDDHTCWERPEDMDTPRSVYFVSPTKPGSDVAGETAAALAAASMVFRAADPAYSRKLLRTAQKVMHFAMQYRGNYRDSLHHICHFYCSSGYKDELLWGAAWLFRATNDVYYLNFIRSLGANDAADIFSWDNKYAGARILLSRGSLLNRDMAFHPFRHQAEDFICRILPNSPYSSTNYTPGGLMFKLKETNLQYVTAITFLLTTYSKYMAATKHTFNCGGLCVQSNTLEALSKKQVDYILGENPLKMSYMVGYGSNYPRRIHHRGASLPSKAEHPQAFGCKAAFRPFFYTSNPNPNILVGAVVGGPYMNDSFRDDRTDYEHLEPTTYTNAAIVGPLAYFAGRKQQTT